MPKQKKSSSNLLKYLLVFGLFLGITSRIVYLKMVNPSGINEVSSGMVATSGITAEEQARLDSNTIGKPGAKLPNGCVSKQVQCIKAPCPPVWSCPPGVTPPPEDSRVCTQEAGSCIGIKGQCETYTDGCKKAALCASPYQKCDMTRPTPPSTTPQPCVTRPSCPAGRVCPTTALAKGQIYCDPKPTIPPAPSPSLRPSCTCPAGAVCKLSADCNKPTPAPVVSGLASFSATKSCGASSFMNISYSCTMGKSQIVLANGSCVDMYSALKKAISYCATITTGVDGK